MKYSIKVICTCGHANMVPADQKKKVRCSACGLHLWIEQTDDILTPMTRVDLDSPRKYDRPSATEHLWIMEHDKTWWIETKNPK